MLVKSSFFLFITIFEPLFLLFFNLFQYFLNNIHELLKNDNIRNESKNNYKKLFLYRET